IAIRVRASIGELRHNHIFHRLHRPEAQDEPAFGVRLEQARLDGLRRGDEEGLNPAGLEVEQEILEDPEELAVLGHDRLAAQLRGEELHAGLPRISRGAYFSFLANSWPDVGIKASDDYSNHSSRLVTALSYTPRGLQPGACPEADVGPYRDRAQRVPRPGHLRRGALHPRDERVPGRDPRNAARPPAAPRGDRPPGRLSAADGGSQAELGLPRQREGLQEGPRGDRACGRRIRGPRRLPQPHRARRRREPLPDGPRLRRRRAAADLAGPSRAAGPMARGRGGPHTADGVAAPTERPVSPRLPGQAWVHGG